MYGSQAFSSSRASLCMRRMYCAISVSHEIAKQSGKLSLLCRIEAPQARGWLVFPGLHEEIASAYEIVFIADIEIVVDLAQVLDPDRLGRAPGVPRYHPGTRQCIVDGGDLVMDQIWIGLVEVDPFLDDCFVVAVQG